MNRYWRCPETDIRNCHMRDEHFSVDRNSAREPVAEHRLAAFRFGLGYLVLKHIPMLGKATVLDPDYVGSYPCDGTPVARKAAVDNNVVAFRQDELVFVAQSVRRATDKVEQAVTAWLDMGAVLDVAL